MPSFSPAETGSNRKSMHGIANIPAQDSTGPATANFCAEIGYLVSEQGAFRISTENVDAEIATIAGPHSWFPSIMPGMH